jgi:hypothetical protein
MPYHYAPELERLRQLYLAALAQWGDEHARTAQARNAYERALGDQ